MNRSNGGIRGARWKRRGALHALLATTIALLAACGESQAPQLPGSAVPGGPDVVDTTVGANRAEWIDDRLNVDVPVPIIAIGFDADQIAALQAALPPHTVLHNNGDLNQSLPPDVDEAQEQQDFSVLLPLAGETFTVPVVPTAQYQVRAAPDGLVAGFERTLASAKLSDTIYDANLVEDYFAAALPQHGFATNPNAPPLVILHLEAFGIGEHAWRTTGTTGFLEPVRLFGARQPLLVFDPSALADPYGGDDGFRAPVGAGDSANIARFVVALTEFRILQGSIYPIALDACHAVTGIMAVRETSVAQATPLLRPVEETLFEDNLRRSFENLTGAPTHFDFKLLYLPADDPVLDALLRLEFPGMEVLRAYLSTNFDRYHVAHEGCEAYLSVVAQSDAAAVPGGGVLGIGTYDDSPGHRISMSWVHDAFRLLFDPESPVGIYAGSGQEYLNWWEYLFSHETGHLYGQRHPHDISSDSYEGDPADPLGSDNAYSSIWTSMSYQQDGRMIDFGYTDQANWKRNRAGYALREAAAAGREGSAEWNAAMAHASRLEWTAVWETLRQ
ncbi:MAG TPA: hypothetical protein VGE51_06925 [Fontimonas sp.]